MKTLKYLNFPKLSHQKKDVLIGLFLVLFIAVLYYVQWGYYLTNVTDSKVSVDFPQKYFWWADDSRDYRMTGDWMFGRSSETVIDVRPWVYPLFVGIMRVVFAGNAEKYLWLSQFVMWMMSIVLVYLTLYNATRKTFLAIIGSGLFLSHPSPLVLTFHGMTETLNILLLCIFGWLMSSNAKWRYILGVLALSILTSTKPTYQIQLALFILYVLFRWFRLPTRSMIKQLALILLVLTPIWIQLAFSFSYNRSLSISNIGPNTFKNFYVAVVYENVENKPWRQSLKDIEGWDLQKQLSYLWQHQRESFLTYRRNLIDTNQWVGSFFIRGDNNRMVGFVEAFNSGATYLHLIMLPLMLYFLFSEGYKENKELVAVLYFVFLIQTLISGISTGQDDRLTVTGVPLWLISYLLVLYSFFVARSSDIFERQT